MVFNPSNDLPLNGLEDVVSIFVVVDTTSEISDISLHACRIPGNIIYLYFLPHDSLFLSRQKQQSYHIVQVIMVTTCTSIFRFNLPVLEYK